MRTLGSVGVRSFRRARGRWLLTASGITLGVAILFAVQVANTSASRTVERRFGASALAVIRLTTGDRHLPADVGARVARFDGVRIVNTYVSTDVRLVGHERHGKPWMASLSAGDVVRGPDFDREGAGGPPMEVQGHPPRSDKDEIVIGGGDADDLGVGLGDQLRIALPSGEHALTVVQIQRRRDGEKVAFGLSTTIATAERLGGDRLVREAIVQLAPDVDGDTWLDAHRRDLGPNVLASSTGFDATSFREFVKSMNDGFAVGALTAVFVGAFLIFLTMSMQVTERTATFGTFRALGASRRQTARVVLTEALVLGALATAAGLVLGGALAVGLTRVISNLYRVESSAVVVTPGAVVLAVIAGIVVTVLGAAVPAWRASTLEPVAAMRRDLPEPRARLRLAWFGVVLGVVAIVVGLVKPPTRNDPTLLFVLAGVVLALPLLIRPLASAVGRVTARISPGIGRVAVLHLEKERSRSAYTMGLVMVVLSTVFSMGTVQATFERELSHIVSATMGGDLSVGAANGFDKKSLAAISDLDETAAVTSFRFLDTRLATPSRVQRATIVAIDPASYFEVLGLPLLQGRERDVRRALSTDSAVAVISEHDARDLDVSVGDTMPVQAPGRDVRVRIIGVIANLDTSWHPIMVSESFASSRFGAGQPTFLRLRAAEGRADALQTSVEHLLRSRGDVQVQRAEQERADAHRFNKEFFSIFQVVMFVALVVGLLGLANTLAFSILRRTREIGVLRATGTQRREIVAMVAVEALTLAGAAAVLAVPLGAVISALVVKSVAVSLRATIPLTLAWTMVPIVVIVAALLAVAAALLPARRAARLDPVQSLRFD